MHIYGSGQPYSSVIYADKLPLEGGSLPLTLDVCGLLLRHHPDNSVRQQVGLTKTYVFPTLPFFKQRVWPAAETPPRQLCQAAGGSRKSVLFPYIAFFKAACVACC